MPSGQADWHGAPTSSLQTKASHRLSTMCSLVLVAEVAQRESTGFGAVWPSPHIVVSFTTARQLLQEVELVERAAALR